MALREVASNCREFMERSRKTRSKGVCVLLTGSTGTGKALVAEVLAKELDLDLYRVDLSGVVSKYGSETEKDLDDIFRRAEQTQSILIFDETDALFGKRTDVKNAHDRFANIEVTYLRERLEEFKALALLATSSRLNLDEAFLRQIRFEIHLPHWPPKHGARRRTN